MFARYDASLLLTSHDILKNELAFILSAKTYQYADI